MQIISLTRRPQRRLLFFGAIASILVAGLLQMGAVHASESVGERLALGLMQRNNIAEAFRDLERNQRAAVREEALVLLGRYGRDGRTGPPPDLTAGQRALLGVAVATAKPVPRQRAEGDDRSAQDLPFFNEGRILKRWKSRWRGRRVRCWGITGRWDLKSFSLVKIAELWQRTHVCTRKGRVRVVRIPRAHRGYDILVPLLSFADRGAHAHNADWEGRGFYRLEAIAGYGPFTARQTHCLQLRLNRRVNVYAHSISCQLV